MLTVGSWNLHQRASAWTILDDLMARHDAVAFAVQEAGRPPAARLTEPPWDASAPAWTLPVPRCHRRYGSAIAWAEAARDIRPVRPVPLGEAEYGVFAASHPGQFAVVDVPWDSRGEEVVTLISLYGIWDRIGEAGELYTDASLHRALSDLTMLIRDRDRPNIVLGGDLNIWHDYDRADQRFASVFQRLEALGLHLIGPFKPDHAPPLERCPCRREDCRHVLTYRYRGNPKNVPYQNDFLFASAAMRERLVRCYAIDEPSIWEHSDHLPIVAVFEGA